MCPGTLQNPIPGQSGNQPPTVSSRKDPVLRSCSSSAQLLFSILQHCLHRQYICSRKGVIPNRYCFSRISTHRLQQLSDSADIPTPPSCDLDLQDDMRLLQNFVLREYNQAEVPKNLSHGQTIALQSLKKKKNTLHFSVSDKGGECVVMSKTSQQQLTHHHLTSTPVYHYLVPTLKVNSVETPILRPTETSFRNFWKRKCSESEEACNKVFGRICSRLGVGKRFQDTFEARHTTLPAMYVLVKTHNFDPSTDLSTLPISDIKVRPIVSCVNYLFSNGETRMAHNTHPDTPTRPCPESPNECSPTLGDVARSTSRRSPEQEVLQCGHMRFIHKPEC